MFTFYYLYDLKIDKKFYTLYTFVILFNAFLCIVTESSSNIYVFIAERMVRVSSFIEHFFTFVFLVIYLAWSGLRIVKNLFHFITQSTF